jgi:hypothetical protein
VIIEVTQETFSLPQSEILMNTAHPDDGVEPENYGGAYLIKKAT